MTSLGVGTAGSGLEPVVARFDLDRDVDLALTLGPHRHGAADPTIRLARHEAWHAMRTPEGPATVHLVLTEGRLDVAAWGPGAAWASGRADSFVGAHDDRAGFDAAGHALVDRLARRFAGMRFGSAGRVFELAVPTVLGQRVTAGEAIGAWHRIVRRWGTPAPGPGAAMGLHVAPEPRVVLGIDDAAMHHLGVERGRARTIRTVARHAARLDAAAACHDRAELERVLGLLPGVGPWTTSILLGAAVGDADAVVVGDFHIPHHVCAALAGEQRGDDDRMLELLAPFAGHRGRVQRLVLLGTRGAEKRGPRYRPLPIARW